MENIFYPFNKKNQWKERLSSALLLIVAGLSILLSACQDEEIVVPVIDRAPVLSASASELALNQKQANQTALTFNWTPGSNQGTNAAVDYTLQIDRPGNNFESPLNVELGRGAYAKSYRVAELNAMFLDALGLSPQNSAEIVARIVATVADDAVEPAYSNETTISVTPYEPVTATLYLIGDATPNGWSADNATPLSPADNDPTTFSVLVPLQPGNFKFITTLGQFLPSYNKGGDDQSLVYRSEDDQPDEQFVIPEGQGGMYNITVNLVDLRISIEPTDGPAYSQLWVVGSATPNGWDLDNAHEMVQSNADPFVFTYTNVLSEGELKIATAKNWDAPFYRPTEGDAPLSSTEVQLSAGDPDHKWLVSEPGLYKITLNLRDMSITYDRIENLYLVGDAGPNGWDIANPAPMSRNGGVFTYTGPLTAGELKISMFKGDWCDGQWINAATENQDITNPDYIITSGCDGPDNKWRVTDATSGNYTITIDLGSGSMSIEQQ